jgi:hypothetical protein
MSRAESRASPIAAARSPDPLTALGWNTWEQAEPGATFWAASGLALGAWSGLARGTWTEDP